MVPHAPRPWSQNVCCPVRCLVPPFGPLFLDIRFAHSLLLAASRVAIGPRAAPSVPCPKAAARTPGPRVASSASSRTLFGPSFLSHSLALPSAPLFSSGYASHPPSPFALSARPLHSPSPLALIIPPSPLFALFTRPPHSQGFPPPDPDGEAGDQGAVHHPRQAGRDPGDLPLVHTGAQKAVPHYPLCRVCRRAPRHRPRRRPVPR